MTRTWIGAAVALAIAAVIAPAALAATDSPAGDRGGGGVGETGSPGEGLEAPPDEVIIRLDQRVRPEPSMSADERRRQRRAIDRGQSEVAREVRARGGSVRRRFATVPLLSATVPEARQAELAERDDVDAVVPNWPVRHQLDDALPLIGATEQATEGGGGGGLTGSGQAVAVIDTGIQRDHEFFTGADGSSHVAAEACFLTVSNDTCPDGSDQQTDEVGAAEPFAGNWHGLHVAGIAAGTAADRGADPDRGAAPEADILAANVFDSTGAAYTDDIIAALEWVYGHTEASNGSHDVAAANLSLGTAPLSPAECDSADTAYGEVVANLREAGALTIAAAGNSWSREFMGAPACVDGVVSVAASDRTDAIAGFSNAAPATDLIAPGVDIRSAGLDNGYRLASGTSMAAPMVAGSAAMIGEGDPAMSAENLLTALQASPVAVDDDRSGGEVSGLPRVDVPAALVGRGVLELSASTTTVTTPPGAELAVDVAELVRGAAADELTVTADAPAALDVVVDGTTLQIAVADSTGHGAYPIEWSVTDGTTTAAATLTVQVSPWQAREPLPVWRLSSTAATDDGGRIYVLGGKVDVAGEPNTFEDGGRVDRYDPATDSWDTVPELSAASDVAAASDGQGRIYALHSGDVVERFDPDRGQWETLAPLEHARRGLVAASDGDGRIYAIGGWDPDSSEVGDTVATVERFDPDGDGGWATIASLDQPREAFGTATDSSGRVYAIGGIEITDAGSTALETVERFVPGDGWEPVAPLDGGARYGHGAAADAGGRPQAVAGWLANAAERYEPGEDTWSQIPAAPRQQARTAVSASGGHVYAVGDLTQRFLEALPDPGTIAGTVTDAAADEPLADAEVTVTGPDDEVVTTDGDGEYAVDVAPGTYDVVVDHPDFDAVTVDGVDVASNATTTVDVALEASVDSVAVTPGEAEIDVGDTEQFTATATYTDGSEADVTDTATWTSTDPTTATIDSGLATALEAGTTELTAELDGHTATATLTVVSTSSGGGGGFGGGGTTEPEVSELAVEPGEAEGEVGDDTQFAATATYTDGSEADVTDTATWTSADPAIATVDNGLATALEAGTTELTAELDGHTATATLTVVAAEPELTGVAVDPGEAEADFGDTEQFTATATYTDGSEADVTDTATWTSTDPAIATIDNGLATALEAGTTELTAELDGHTATATLTVTEPEPEPEPEATRTAGADRFATAARLSAATFEPGVDRAYVATGLGFADALAGGVAAARADAPVLLVASDAVPGATAAELDRLDPAEIVILGGSSAVGTGVADALAGFTDGRVERLAGPERFATAARVARHAFPRGADTVYVGTGLDFPDVLAGVPAAAAEDAPLLLATADTVPSATAAELDQLDPDRIVVLGGEGVIGREVETALAEWGTVERVAGPDRFATAAAVAERLGTADTAYLATGLGFADALTAGAVAGAERAPMLLVTSETIPAPTAAALQRLTLTRIRVMGGTGVVSDDVETQLSAYLDS